ncbi:MAG: BMP family ABC transporter substrate-binding protein [Chloroflexaceae bacterium]|nr:BMP family ABC transporter substrate-binding protein [Chloroflexaceae bacterium]
MVLALLLPALIACGGTPATPPAAAPAAEEAPAEEAPAAEEAAPAASGEPFRVAVVMPSSTTDLAWSQAMYDALRAIQEEMGGEAAMEISFSESMFNVTDAAAALRDYATDGNNLVIAHGTQYGTSLFEVARDFPETSFAWGTAIDTGEAEGLTNIFAYNAKAAEGGYINGVIAALLSQDDVIGIIGPVEAGDAKDYIDGFENGVLATKPDASVQKTYTGSFGDTALAAEAANVQIEAGADVLTGSAQQVVGAIGVAQENNVLWLGTQSSQASLAPELVVATQLYDWSGVVGDMIGKIQSGELGGTAYELTLENGGLKIEFNAEYDLPAEVQTAAEEAIQAVQSGEIDPLAGS